MDKNVRCTRKALVLSTKPIVIFDVLVAVASSDRNKDAVNVVSKSVLLAADVIEFATLGSLSNDDGDGNENGKKAIGLDWQNDNFTRVSRFFVHFVAVVPRLQRETV